MVVYVGVSSLLEKRPLLSQVVAVTRHNSSMKSNLVLSKRRPRKRSVGWLRRLLPVRAKQARQMGQGASRRHYQTAPYVMHSEEIDDSSTMITESGVPLLHKHPGGSSDENGSPCPDLGQQTLDKLLEHLEFKLRENRGRA